MIETLLDILTNIQGCEEAQCPASAFTAIGAAFATQGYYLQSSIISAIGAGHMEYWGVFLYLFSFLGFTIMIILNGLQIPKNVMWFVLGPALFNWMIYTGADVEGVAWRVGNAPRMDQSRVWEIAEPGLRNIDPIVAGGELDTSKSSESDWVNRSNISGQRIRVAWLFLFWDELISDTVAQLSAWVGADRLRSGYNSQDTNLGTEPIKLSNSDDVKSGMGAILANLKWSKLQAISNARISTPGLRDAFVELMSGTCAEPIRAMISEDKVVSARRGAWGDYKSIKNDDIYIIDQKDPGYKDLQNELVGRTIPKAGSFQRLWDYAKDNEKSRLKTFLTESGINLENTFDKNEKDYITCNEAMMMVISALRWEAASQYHKMMSDWSTQKNGNSEDDVLAAFYYGWYLDKGNERLPKEQLKYFTRDMIFAYLLRNELEFVPKITNVQFSTKVQAEQATDTHIASLGSQNKFGEIYTWARMMPYIQGILMFILAGAYPIVCIVFIIPGMHKTIITWAAFWAWVKFWDLGFAIVTVVERSVWGILGNSDQAKVSNSLITAVLQGEASGGKGLIATEVSCQEGLHGIASSAGSLWGSGIYSGMVKEGGTMDCINPFINNVDTSTSLDEAITWFSKGTAIGLSLNYGVYNGYYIYIMAALYMAVPFICGQVILQGKHGVNQLAGMMTGGAEKAGGSAAETSAKSKMSADIMNTAGIAKRQVQADAASKYAINALDAGNKAAEFGLQGQYVNSHKSGIGLKEQALNTRMEQAQVVASKMGTYGQLFAANWPIFLAASGLNTLRGNESFQEYVGFKTVKGTDGNNYRIDPMGYKVDENLNRVKDGEGNYLKWNNGIFSPDDTNATSGSTNMNSDVVAPRGASSNGLAATGATGATGFSWGIGGLTFGGIQAAQAGFTAYQLYPQHLKEREMLPFKQDAIRANADNLLMSFDSGAQQNLQKGYADRMDTMAKYQGELAGYEMMQELAMSNQHIAGVYGANLMPQQKAYDTKGMIGSGEIVSNDGRDAKGMFNFFNENEDRGYKSLIDGYSNHLNYNYNSNNIMNSGFDHLSSIDSHAGISRDFDMEIGDRKAAIFESGNVMGLDKGGNVNSDLKQNEVGYGSGFNDVFPAKDLVVEKTKSLYDKGKDVVNSMRKGLENAGKHR